MKKIFIAICIIVVIASIIFEFSVLGTYGNKPTGEVPFWWVLWFLLGDQLMDNLKKETVKDYTAWDLNCKFVCMKNRQKLEAIFKRKARRKIKELLRREKNDY